MATVVYVGRIPPRADERDLEDFFKGYGKIEAVQMKNGYCFVEFRDYRDADDAVHDLNGKELMGMRMIIEMARGTPHGRDAARYGYGTSGRYGPPPRSRGQRAFERTDYRIVVENMSSRSSWQDLKDLFRTCCEVAYAEANVRAKNEGILEFYTRSDMMRAYDKMDGEELDGRKLRLVIVDKKGGRSRKSRSYSRSRSRSKDRKRRKSSRSSSRGRSDDERRDSGKKRSRKESGRSPSRSVSRSPKKEDDEDRRSATPEAGRDDANDKGAESD